MKTIKDDQKNPTTESRKHGSFGAVFLVLLIGVVAQATSRNLYAQIVTLYGNSASFSGPDIVHAIDKTTGGILEDYSVSSGDGRGVAVVGNILYSTESGPPGDNYGGSNKIYMTDLTTDASLGTIIVSGLPSGEAMSTLAWDGSHFWASEYLGGNHVYEIDLSGNIVKTITLELVNTATIFGADGLEYFNGKLISNRGDGAGPYDVYDLDGNLLHAAFIDPGSIGVGFTTGIAFDGTDFYTSDANDDQLEIWDGTTGAHKGTLLLSNEVGPFQIEDLSVDYARRADTADTDGDGVLDANDCNPLSDPSPTVVIDGCDSGVPNFFPDADGCNVVDDIANLAAVAKNHGKFSSGVAAYLNALKKAGLISGAQQGAIQSCAGQAQIP